MTDSPCIMNVFFSPIAPIIAFENSDTRYRVQQFPIPLFANRAYRERPPTRSPSGISSPNKQMDKKGRSTKEAWNMTRRGV